MVGGRAEAGVRGDRADLRVNGNTSDGDESFLVSKLSDDAVTVEAPGSGRDYAFLYDSPAGDVLVADPAEVDTDECEIEERLGDEVAVADHIEGVLERTGEAEIGCVLSDMGYSVRGARACPVTNLPPIVRQA